MLVNSKKNNNTTTACLVVLIILTIGTFAFSTAHLYGAEEKNHLAEGIKLYHSGRYNEALTEFRAELEINEHCPLLYYYAARIRIAKEQYRSAQKNLEAALRDSTDFHDAHALLAVTFLNMGNEANALTAWNTFVKAAGSIGKNTPVTVDSIMFPEEYHRKLEAERKELERLEAERRERDRIESEHRKAKEMETREAVTGEQPAQTEEHVATSDTESYIIPREQQTDASDTGSTPGDIEIPLENLETRINTSIRTGIYGILLVLSLLGIGTFTFIYWIRRRKTAKEEMSFSEEVERFLNEREYEPDEEKTIREFEIKKQDLLQSLQPDREHQEQESVSVVEDTSEEPLPSPQVKHTATGMNESHITEEVKALVSRLHREGRSPEEIAHTADLSRTEVDLILAVREHHIDNLIDEVNRGENVIDRDELLHAIHDLSAEGTDAHEIAKKLNISLSEVSLASSVLAMQHNNED